MQAARTLIRAYVDWQRETYADLLSIIENCFATVEAELVALPDPYAPRGRLPLAYVDGEAAGVVTLKEREQGVCMMQRMFVYPRFQGQGIGRALANRLIAEARGSGPRRPGAALDLLAPHLPRQVAVAHQEERGIFKCRGTPRCRSYLGMLPPRFLRLLPAGQQPAMCYIAVRYNP